MTTPRMELPDVRKELSCACNAMRVLLYDIDDRIIESDDSKAILQDVDSLHFLVSKVNDIADSIAD